MYLELPTIWNQYPLMSFIFLKTNVYEQQDQQNQSVPGSDFVL